MLLSLLVMSALTTGQPVFAAGWLGDSATTRAASRKLSRAFSASAGLHCVFLLLIVLFVRNVRPPDRPVTPPVVVDIATFIVQPEVTGVGGGGGGGGGSPAPAPRKPLEIPRHRPPVPVPAASTPTKPDPAPLPVLDVPVQTDLARVMQASGSSVVSLATYGGGGRGGGLGEGVGAGVGPGSGGGTGGGSGGGVGSGVGRGFGSGAHRPGAGITNPALLRLVQPKYTGEAMRAKIQGVVELEAVVLPDGCVGDIRVVRSLDRVHGLDAEAITAAREWLFAPGRDSAGRPVPVIVRVILEFRIH